MNTKYILNPCLISLLLIATFSCSENDDGQGPLEGNGNITFYFSKPMPCHEVVITLVDSKGNEAEAKIRGDRVHPSVPSCGEVPAVSFMNRSYGTYSYTMVCGGMSSGDGIKLQNPCHTHNLNPL